MNANAGSHFALYLVFRCRGKLELLFVLFRVLRTNQRSVNVIILVVFLVTTVNQKLKILIAGFGDLLLENNKLNTLLTVDKYNQSSSQISARFAGLLELADN